MLNCEKNDKSLPVGRQGLRRNRSFISVTIAGIQNHPHHPINPFPHSQILCFFISSTIYSDVRMLNARIVHVMFLSAWLTKGPPSTQKRFLQSCAWLHLFNAERLGSLPIRTVPAS